MVGSSSVPSLQLIDENKQFNQKLLPYMQKFYDSNDDKGLNYHIVSVFGSQSTGKSTLLNKLFATKFDVMDESKREQTTKGIWLSHANSIASLENPSGHSNKNNIYVLDVEGVDGREKAEDKDFERKSALFALSTSEVLIINIWEHQVGLYQGANLELLKTVFEVNLSLFHSSRQKCLLLFVIRDFTGVTPIENLSRTLGADLHKIWNDLNKPDGCEDVRLTDFFDLKFEAIAHKHFQPEKFEHDIKALGDKFYAGEELTSAKYHRGIPIDAWTLYSQQIWDQIELNKDLDLPTQQILVARFRCDEIAEQTYYEFEQEFSQVDFDSMQDLEKISLTLQDLRRDALAIYDDQAARYINSVYLERRDTLQHKVDTKLKRVHSQQLKNLTKEALKQFTDNVTKAKKTRSKLPFGDLLNSSSKQAVTFFIKEATIFHFAEAFNYSAGLEKLQESIVETSEQLKLKEKSNLLVRLTKRFQTNFKEDVVDILTNPTRDSWDNILDNFQEKKSTTLNAYQLNNGDYDFKLGLPKKVNTATAAQLEKTFWLRFREIIHDFVSEDTVARILRNQFEDLFKYDEEGLPKVWKNAADIDIQFNKARIETLGLLPVFANATLSSTGEEIIPDVDLVHEDDYDDDEDEEEGNSHNFSHLLSNKEQNNISKRLKKETDAIYVEAKRSIVLSSTQIPLYIYAIIIVLGWNEFMTILRNPLLFGLSIVVISGVYVAYNMEMLGPILTIVFATLNQTKKVVKERLKDLLLDDHEKAGFGHHRRVPPSKAYSEPITEEVELEDFSNRAHTLNTI